MFVLRRAHGTIAIGAIDAFMKSDRPHPDETALASTFGGVRKDAWLGGRAAVRVALAAHGAEWTGPILSTTRGAPRVGPTLRASISHKGPAVVALVASNCEMGHVGIDLEETLPLRIDISRKVLTADELTRLPEEPVARDAMVRTVFSIKEAVYKAIDPFVGRYIGFHEVTLLTSQPLAHALETSVVLRTGEAFIVESTWETLDHVPGYTLATARARRA